MFPTQHITPYSNYIVSSLSHHFSHSCTLDQPSNSSSIHHYDSPSLDNTSPSIITNPEHDLPTFFVLTDSHGKHFSPFVITQDYKLIVKSISGLQWFNTYNPQLCTRTILMSSELKSILSNCIGLLFLIGTNSIRNTLAMTIIHQIEDIIDLIRSHYPHLNNKNDISICMAFPCLKLSHSFSTMFSLSSNLNTYNELLNQLSMSKGFNVIDLQITVDKLARDGMHVHFQHFQLIKNIILKYFTDIINQRRFNSNCHRRSRNAITRRNRIRHNKIRNRQKLNFITRQVATAWSIKEIKHYLKDNKIKFNRLLNIYNQHLQIQFNHSFHQESAEKTLPLDAFNEKHYFDWHEKCRS